VTDTGNNDLAAEALFTGLPRFTAPVLDIVAEPPFVHRDTVLHCFVLRSDQAKLQVAVDMMFQPLGLSYQVASSAALLTALYVGQATATAGRYARFGWSSEIDLAFWSLARGQDGKLVWIPFYMFVDSGIALVAGREVYGFPKQLAQFERDMTTIDRDPGVAVRTSFFPPAVGQRGAVNDILVRIRRSQGEALLENDGRGLERIDAGVFTARFAEAMGQPVELMPEITPPYGTPNGIAVPMLLLKQFRDAEAPDRACYRAAVCADSRSLGPVQIALVTEEIAVDLTASGSHPIADDLGLVSGMTAEAGFVIQQDFEVNRARIVS